MKATGIVRRIDDLGRVVIPKEIRRTLRIREGEPLEIYTDNTGSVIFKKYSPIGEQGQLAAQLCDSVSKICNRGFVICDRDGVIAASQNFRKELEGRAISPELEEQMQSRQLFSDEAGIPVAAGGADHLGVVMAPIIVSGDLCGCAIFLKNDQTVSDAERKLAQVSALFFAKQMED